MKDFMCPPSPDGSSGKSNGSSGTRHVAPPMRALVRFWKKLAEHHHARVRELEAEKRFDDLHIDILCSALAEIKATHDGDSAQPIGDILNGAAEEIRELKAAYAAHHRGEPQSENDLSRGDATASTEGNINSKESGTPADPI